MGEAFGWLDLEAVHLSARARTWRDPRDDGGGRAHQFSIGATDSIARRITIAAAMVRSTYRTALASSLNIPAVKVLLAAGGPEALHERLRTCGLTTLNHPAEIYGLGLTLGNCEARLLELTNAYASLARLGEFGPWRLRADPPTFSRSLLASRNWSGRSPIS